jgi:pyruvate carboxylase
MLTDTSMRDAHQSLFATRMRTRDMLDIAPYYAHRLPQLLSMECWGGATFDVALRFLKEDPWERLGQLARARAEHPLPDAVALGQCGGLHQLPGQRGAVFHPARPPQAGVDIFRVFDSLNWVDNMRVAMDSVIESGGVCEAAICYTGDIFDPTAQPSLTSSITSPWPSSWRKPGRIFWASKTWRACVGRAPFAPWLLPCGMKRACPSTFHTHDTSGIAAASVLAAVEAGCGRRGRGAWMRSLA